MVSQKKRGRCGAGGKYTCHAGIRRCRRTKAGECPDTGTASVPVYGAGKPKVSAGRNLYVCNRYSSFIRQ